MAQPIEAVLFDFGGVFTPSPFAALAELAGQLGISPESLIDVVFGSYSSDTDHPWHRLERGEISLEKARTAILELGVEAGFRTDVFELFGAMAQSGEPRREFVECARDVKRRGLRTGLLTNNIAEFREHWTKMLPMEELFDDVVDSSEVGMRKPDPRIYALAVQRLATVASQAVFLDDHPGNVEAAQDAGLRGILVGADGGPAIAELQGLLRGR